ncbi:MAG: threonine aldolase [Clostridia bacterium]|nr:threonine aldolase [Clostridia bacterium]
MISFRSDYSQGAHPKVMEALAATNLEHTDGYGEDAHCRNAAAMIRRLVGREDCAVHFMIGGTSANITLIAAALRPYESVVAARSGHIYFHETGAIEATGHRVLAVDGEGGKLTPALVERALAEYRDEHTPLPRMIYLSQSTEIGTLYDKAELTALRELCDRRGLYLYLDGARLGAALTSEQNDLTLPDLAKLCDAFYLGGTKNAALFGEALVILRPEINDHFRWMIKRQGGMFAKGRLIGVQFEALFEGGEKSVYFSAAAHANAMAKRLREGMEALGVSFLGRSPTNQQFPILPAPVVRELEKEFFFYEWAPEEEGRIPIRLVTGWGTKPEEVETFLTRLAVLLRA